MVKRMPDLSLVYVLTSEEGEQRTLSARDVWHIRGLSWNGWMGLETVKLAREAIGLSLALEEAHSRLHKNGVQPSGTYSVDAKLTDEQHKKLTAWIKASVAQENRSSPLVLDNGAKWLAQQMSGVDAQHVQTRQLQIQEICRAMNVQPMMVFAVDKPTYGSAEQLFTAHVVHTLMPLYELIEQSADVYLLEALDDTGYFTAFNPRGLMRGSLKDQAEYFSKALANRPWMTQDEVRDETDLSPEGGDAATRREPPNVAAQQPPPTESEPDPADPAEDEETDG